MPKPKRADSRKGDRGEGGELHQRPLAPEDRLTTNLGVPLSDNQNSLAGTRGPSLLERGGVADDAAMVPAERGGKAFAAAAATRLWSREAAVRPKV